MARYTQPRRTWRYTNEFKVKAVELSHLEDVKVQDVAKTLDTHPFAFPVEERVPRGEDGG